jgi:hypothetical protein
MNVEEHLKALKEEVDFIEREKMLGEKYPYQQGESEIATRLRMTAYCKEKWPDCPLKQIIKFVEDSIYYSRN